MRITAQSLRILITISMSISITINNIVDININNITINIIITLCFTLIKS